MNKKSRHSGKLLWRKEYVAILQGMTALDSV